jgi:hypothetical protein
MQPFNAECAIPLFLHGLVVAIVAQDSNSLLSFAWTASLRVTPRIFGPRRTGSKSIASPEQKVVLSQKNVNVLSSRYLSARATP